MSIFYSESHADSAISTPSANDPGMLSFAPLILIFAIFYFLLIRPQQKKYKEQREMIDKLKIGEVVSTSGGIIGSVHAVDAEKNLVELEISKGVIIKVVRSNISALITDKKDEDQKEKKSKKIAKYSK